MTPLGFFLEVANYLWCATVVLTLLVIVITGMVREVARRVAK